jgi:hypothetical protein
MNAVFALLQCMCLTFWKNYGTNIKVDLRKTRLLVLIDVVLPAAASGSFVFKNATNRR